ncbi:MAG: TetR family transcriptional regulator, partial [Myxococcales bacterium]|nr:TetR family transcriptional regulator [Myxococcales bacterium]
MPRKLDLARRAELAAQAVDVLRARGVHRCTMSDLAAALGLKRPTLYFYFRDLGAVFEAVLEDTLRRFVEYVVRRTAAVEHPVDALIETARASADFTSEQRELVVLLLQLWSAQPGDAEPMIARGQELAAPMRAGLTARLADGIAAGLVAPCDPARIVDLMMATLDGALVAQVTRRAAPH